MRVVVHLTAYVQRICKCQIGLTSSEVRSDILILRTRSIHTNIYLVFNIIKTKQKIYKFSSHSVHIVLSFALTLHYFVFFNILQRSFSPLCLSDRLKKKFSQILR